MQWAVFVVRRLLLLFPVVVGVFTIAWAALAQLPINDQLVAHFGSAANGWSPTIPCSTGNPGGPRYPQSCPNPQYLAAVHQLGLDQPAYVQWGIYVWNSLSLNWGTTDLGGASPVSPWGPGPPVAVATAVSWYLPYTLELTALSIAVTLAVVVYIARALAADRNGLSSRAGHAFGLSGYSIAVYLLSLLVIVAAVSALGGPSSTGCETAYERVAGSWPPAACYPGGIYPSFIGPQGQTHPTGIPTLDAFLAGDPASGFSSLERLVLPALIAGFFAATALLRSQRPALTELGDADHVRFSRALGVPEAAIVRRHVGRLVESQTLGMLGATAVGVAGTLVIVEAIFGLNGLGSLLLGALGPSHRLGLGFGVFQAWALVGVSAYLGGDLLQSWLDPRVRSAGVGPSGGIGAQRLTTVAPPAAPEESRDQSQPVALLDDRGPSALGSASHR